MKARNRKTRWLLVSLLFGFLAAMGMILTHHSRVGFVTTASQPVPPKQAMIQRLHAALVAAIGGKQTLLSPAIGPPAHELAHSAYSNDPQPDTSGHSDSSSNATAMTGASPQGMPVGGTDDGPQQTNPSATSSTDPTAPEDGRYVYSGYVPLECGLPAGCGVVSTGHASHPPSTTVGTVPVAHDSQGANPPEGGPNDPGQSSNPPGPGSDSSVAAAPELDPATLAGAITLLLGSLAVLRGRRVRLSRAPRSRVTR